MKRLYPDLWRTAEEKQFGVLTVHAYLLERPGGNVLFYNPRSTVDFEEISDLGGIAHHCLSHCHEVDESLVEVAGRFDSKLCCHALVRPICQKRFPPTCFSTLPRASFWAAT